MLTRRASVELIYNGKNISKDVLEDLSKFTYTDNASGAADDITVTLANDTSKWTGSWYPEKGATLQAKILTQNWQHEGDKQVLDCGQFLIDELEAGNPPSTFIIGAASIPNNDSFTRTKKSRTWEAITLKGIAGDIANSAGLSLFYDTRDNPYIDFNEQSNTSDMEFLYSLCKKYGLAMKVYSKKIIIYSERECERKDPVATIRRNDVDSWSAKSSLTETGYTGCTVKYYDPDDGEEISYTFRINRSGPQKILEVNESVDSYAEAERLAKSKLREANKKENEMNIVMIGRTDLVSAVCVNLEDFGRFDGKYFIDKAIHAQGDGYGIKLEMHKVLEGY